MKEAFEVDLLPHTIVGLAHILKLDHPTREIYAQSLVPNKVSRHRQQTKCQNFEGNKKRGARTEERDRCPLKMVKWENLLA